MKRNLRNNLFKLGTATQNINRFANKNNLLSSDMSGNKKNKFILTFGFKNIVF